MARRALLVFAIAQGLLAAQVSLAETLPTLPVQPLPSAGLPAMPVLPGGVPAPSPSVPPMIPPGLSLPPSQPDGPGAVQPQPANVKQPTPKASESPLPKNKMRHKQDEIRYDRASKTFILEGNVNIQVRGVTMTGERFEYDEGAKVLSTDKPFKLVQPREGGGEQVITGSAFTYHTDLRRAVVYDAFLEMPAPSGGQKVYIKGDRLTSFNGGERLLFNDGEYTTCNVIEKGQQPHYDVKASVIDVAPDDRIVSFNTSLYGGGQQGYWFPVWYFPLLKDPRRAFGAEIGRNEEEGIFIKSRFPYKINNFHDGYVFSAMMVKKGLGLGFEHTWIAYPNSVSALYFYGLPFKDPIRTGNFTSDFFDDREVRLRHKQRLWETAEAELSWVDRDIYNLYSGTALSSVGVSGRYDDREIRLDISDEEAGTIGENLDFTSRLKLGTKIAQTRNRQTRPATADQTLPINVSLSNSNTRNADWNVKLGEATINYNTSWTQSSNETKQEGGTATPTPTPSPSTIPVTENWNNTITYAQPLTQGLNTNLNLRHNSSTSPNANLNRTLEGTWNLQQDLGWGQAKLEVVRFFDLAPAIADRTKRLERIRTRSLPDKLPEISLNFTPLFQEIQPVNISTTIGRYYYYSVFSETLSPNEQIRGRYDSVKTDLTMQLGSKQHDLGFGTKIDFGQTGYRQNFYQTGDAQFSFTGAVSLTNDGFKPFIPRISYRRDITDEKNNTPFRVDSFGIQRQNRMDGEISIGNIPEMTVKLRSGYDYELKTYQQLAADLNSQLFDGMLQADLQARYSFRPIRTTDVGMLDPAGRMITEADVGKLETRGGTWGDTSLRIAGRIGEAFGGQIGLDSGIKQGATFGVNASYDFNTGKFQNLGHSISFSVGESWLWHVEGTVNSVFDLSGAEKKYHLFNEVSLKKDLHDFVLSMTYNRLFEQFSVNLSMLAFPFSTNDISGAASSLTNQARNLENQIK